MYQIELSLEPHHLVVPSGVSKMIFELWYIWRKPCTYLPPTLTLSQTVRNKIPQDPRQLGVPSGACKPIAKPMVRSTQKRATILHRCQHCLQTDRNEISHDPCHLGVPSGASKMISKPRVRSTQAAHLSCVKISTISKRSKRSFHLSLVT